ncbi:3-carboxy-cis,cis-muconate cycloisomerase family FAD/NAD(P)-binding protein [Nocardia iowensis]|nr:3-carboxy-cis,cis-muconate cycloisomerase family FAD/NAD(P)-binding protein [Nocardia iowensis]
MSKGDNSETLRIAIVGVGPRGLNVFERICANVRDDRNTPGLEVFLIDSTRVGSGAVWRTDQSPLLLMNTVAAQITIFTDDTVQMEGPVVLGPSLFEWADFLVKIGNFADLPEPMYEEVRRIGPNTYPTRALYGHYLRWAYERTRDRYAPWVRAHELTATVTDLRDDATGLQELALDTGDRLCGLHAVVLTQGHLPLTRPTDAGSLPMAARRLGLNYIAPANAADVDLDSVLEREPVLIRGLGLTFFDYMALLTVGRDGCFKESKGALEYIPSGREPLIVAGCRRGVPHHARGANEKGIAGRHVPVLLDAERIAQLRLRADRFGDVDFRRDVWPLISREVESVYYTALIADRISPRELRRFRDRYFAAATDREAGEVLDDFLVAEQDRWNWTTVTDPTAGRRFADPADFQEWLLDYLDADLRHAELGNVRDPVKAALDVLRDLRNEVRQVVDHGGITGRSYRDDLDRWYTPMNAFLSIGPPARRIAELAALIRAGTVRILGPGMHVRVDEDRGCFVAQAALVDHSATTARVLIDAWLPYPDLHGTEDPLLRNLLRRNDVRGYTMGNPDGSTYRTGGLAVDQGSHAVLDGVGRIHPRRYAFGVPTEAVRWVTAAGPRPGVNSVTLSDGDQIARAILAAHRKTRVDTPLERTDSMTIDKGLLAPVRVGVPVESLVTDDAWIEAMLDVELGLSRAQARLGIIPDSAADSVAAAIRTHRFDTRAIAEAARGAANPVVALVELLHRAVADIDPASADYVHYGSTSQDILDTATMLIAARALTTITGDLADTLDSLGRLARRHRDTPIAARTLGMHAVPTTFGAKVAGWMQGLTHARDRVNRVLATGLPIQLGGAAGTFASYVECARAGSSELAAAPPEQIFERLTAEFAAELSLTAGPTPWHTIRTPIADLGGALATVSGALGKFAVDVISQSRTEVVELFEPTAPGRGESSAMPQKRNPALSTMIRAAALQVPGLTSTLFGTLLAEDERPAGAWHAEWQPLRDCLLLVGGAAHTAAELAAGLTADADRMRENLTITKGQLVSERLSIRLTPLLGKTAAKKTLQAAAFEAHASGRALADVLTEDVDVRAHVTQDEIIELLRPENYLGAAPALVDQALRRL